MIRKAESSAGNSSLGLHSADLMNFGHCADFSLALRPKFIKNHESQTENPSVVDSAESQNLVKNNCARSAHLESRPLRGAKNRNQASSSGKADFLLEAEKRGSPPKSEKRQLLGTRFKKVGGSGAGGAALLRKEKDSNEIAESIRDSQSGLPRSHTLARNDKNKDFAESTLDSAILQNQFFPIKKSLHFAESSKKFLPNTALIALGANLKNPIHTFKSLFTKLTRNAKIHILATSPIYKNPPFGFRNQPFFYNATMMLATNLCLLEFYAFMFYLERIFGRARRRAFKNAPRALDIDIIFFNDIFMRSAKLNIPHPHWRTRPSVVVPLLFQVNYKGF